MNDTLQSPIIPFKKDEVVLHSKKCCAAIVTNNGFNSIVFPVEATLYDGKKQISKEEKEEKLIYYCNLFVRYYNEDKYEKCGESYGVGESRGKACVDAANKLGFNLTNEICHIPKICIEEITKRLGHTTYKIV